MQSVNDQIAQGDAGRLRAIGDGGNGEARHVTRLDVVLQDRPVRPATACATLELIQTWLRRASCRADGAQLGECRPRCYGVTVNARDLAEVTESDRRGINALVLAGDLPDPAGAGAPPVAGGVPAGDGAAELLRHAGGDGAAGALLARPAAGRGGLARAVLPVHDPGGGRRGLQHPAHQPGPGGAQEARRRRGHAPGAGPHRRRRSPRAA